MASCNKIPGQPAPKTTGNIPAGAGLDPKFTSAELRDGVGGQGRGDSGTTERVRGMWAGINGSAPGRVDSKRSIGPRGAAGPPEGRTPVFHISPGV